MYISYVAVMLVGTCIIFLLNWIICAARMDSFKMGENVVKVKVEYSLKKKVPYFIPFTKWKEKFPLLPEDGVLLIYT